MLIDNKKIRGEDDEKPDPNVVPPAYDRITEGAEDSPKKKARKDKEE